MKKILSMPLALTLVLAASTSVFAADINQNSTQQKADTTVTFKVDPAYTVTIPANVTLDQKTGTDGTITYEKDLTVSASDVRLLEGKKVQVTLDSSFKLTTGAQGAQYELPYTVKVGTSGSAITNGDVVADFTTLDSDKWSSTLHFAAENPTYAGDYKDTVTFNIAVV